MKLDEMRRGSMTSEDAIFSQLFQCLPPCDAVIGPGDDCAALPLSDGQLLLVAVDQVVGNRHFVLAGAGATPPEMAGRKLLARNLSDIAAMGGVPSHCLVAVALAPPQLEGEWLMRFYQGIIDEGRLWNVAMIGGDLARTPQDAVASLTVLGRVSASTVCQRRGARLGDLLFATGEFGSSLPTGHHLSFKPRLEEGRWLANNCRIRAMMDVSDGLAIDGNRLAAAAGLGLRLNTTAIPRRTAETTLAAALYDGEDYELIFAVSPEQAESLRGAWPFPVRLSCIGEFTAVSGLTDETGRRLSLSQAWDHLLQP